MVQLNGDGPERRSSDYEELELQDQELQRVLAERADRELLEAHFEPEDRAVELRDDYPPVFKDISSFDRVKIQAPPSKGMPRPDSPEYFEMDYQKPLSFFDGEMPLLLVAETTSRQVLAQFVVSDPFKPGDVEGPRVSSSSEKVAREIFKGLEKELDGFRARLDRLVSGKPRGFEIDGPVLNREDGVLSLQVTVDPEKSYDQVYEQILSYFALHKGHDDRDQYRPAESAMLPQLGLEDLAVASNEPFRWTPDNLRMAENAGIAEEDMEPIGDANSIHSDQRHKEILRRQRVWNAHHPDQVKAQEANDASESADQMLRDFFNRND